MYEFGTERALREKIFGGVSAIGLTAGAALLAELGTQSNVADERLGELVTALENVRLDLLRLRSGGGTVEGITHDIAAARRVGDDADRLIAGASEVDALLRRVTPTERG